MTTNQQNDEKKVGRLWRIMWDGVLYGGNYGNHAEGHWQKLDMVDRVIQSDGFFHSQNIY